MTISRAVSFIFATPSRSKQELFNGHIFLELECLLSFHLLIYLHLGMAKTREIPNADRGKTRGVQKIQFLNTDLGKMSEECAEDF